MDKTERAAKIVDDFEGTSEWRECMSGEKLSTKLDFQSIFKREMKHLAALIREEDQDDEETLTLTQVTENADGSADYVFEMSQETLKNFASVGILAVLKNAVLDEKEDDVRTR